MSKPSMGASVRIERLEVKNYRALKDVKLLDVPPLAVFVGANGVGKTTLFDVFGFLRDALLHNVRHAVTARGGFKEVVTRGQTGPISIEIRFREKSGPLATYRIEVGLRDQSPVVARELLQYRRGQHGQPWKFLDFRDGSGIAVTNEGEYGKEGAKEERSRQKLESPDILAIKGLGQFAQFEIVASFRRMIESWHVSDFHIADARSSAEAGLAEYLSSRGDNLPLVAQFLFERHRDVFDHVLRKMAERVPGVAKVEAKATEDGRIVLRFQDGAFKDPFIARYVSDGTIKMFAYLLLLNDPKPHPLLCVEEPENHLYPMLVTALAEEFREYATRGAQVFASTHSPEFLNGATIDEIFILHKERGFTEVRRATDDARLVRLAKAGDPPGALWRQDLLVAAGVR